MSETVEELKCEVRVLKKEIEQTIQQLTAYKVLKKHVLNELLFVVNGIVYDKQASDVLSSGKVLRQKKYTKKIYDEIRINENDIK